MSKTEIPYIILCALVLGYAITFVFSTSAEISFSWLNMLKYSGIALTFLVINIAAKKLAAFKLGCYAEVQPLGWRRYWFYESSYLKHDFPAWLVWPLAFSWLTFGRAFWLANTGFEASPLPSRAARKYAHLTEFDIGVIGAAGIAANLFTAVLAIAFGNNSFAYLNLWFAFFMMLPFPAYDGGKILFADKLFFVFMFTFTLIMLILLHITGIVPTVISAFLFAIVAAFVLYGLRER